MKQEDNIVFPVTIRNTFIPWYDPINEADDYRTYLKYKKARNSFIPAQTMAEPIGQLFFMNLVWEH